MIRRTTNPARCTINKPTGGIAPATVSAPREEVPWRQRANLSLQATSEILGVSVASLYRLEAEGALKFKRVGCLKGRTLVDTAGVIRLADSEDVWAPSTLGDKARAKRAELAANGWKEVRA